VIEKENFFSEDLKVRQTIFMHNQKPASVAIAELAATLRNLNYRNNAYFYALFGIISLWDLQYLIKTEDWKQRYRKALPQWIEALGDWEAMNSLAGFAYSNPHYIFPVISEQALQLRAEGLGHVLIKEDKRINNDIAFDGLGKTLVITGSNMSGKSTFLRTVGVNVVLALAGAPVCARSFTVSVVQVFTSMRTQDSLEESVSSFYAELKRLRQLIQRVDRSTPTLYFLDEILKGTNSKDRHHGAKALIRQLHRYPASGFISTHDLELGNMADEHSDYVQNYSFSSEVVAGKLLFDYKLREGICQSFNASELMKQIGIEM
jgi:DNA mismatch repair ATPase MutS